MSDARQLLQGMGREFYQAQEWLVQDRMSNLLWGPDGAEPEEQTTHASAFLLDVKNMRPALAQRLRSKFGRLAAQTKRLREGLTPGATLPAGVKNVEGHPARVLIYRVTSELPILEEAYEELLASDEYRAVVGPQQHAPRASMGVAPFLIHAE